MCKTYLFCGIFKYLSFTLHITLPNSYYWCYFSLYGIVTDNRDEAANSLMWLRGAAGEPGLHSLNFPAVNMFPWMQQRLDPTMIGGDHGQQYHAMLAAGLQNAGSGDPLRQQMMNFQQPFQYLQQSGSHNPLLQLQHQPIPHNMPQTQTHITAENLSQHLLPQQFNNQTEEQAQQQQHTYHDALQVQSEQLHQRQQLNVPSSSFPKTDFLDSGTKFPASITPRQNVLGSLCPEGTGNLLNLTRAGQSLLPEQLPQQSWTAKYAHQQVNAFANSMSLPPYPGKETTVEPENSNSDSQNPTRFVVNVESSGLLLPTIVPSFATSSNADVSSMPLGDSGYRNSLYNSMQDSSESLHGAEQVDPPNPARTFVKVSS